MPNGGVYAREGLARTLGAQGSVVVASETVGVVKHETTDDAAFVDQVRDPIAHVIDVLRAG